jgi:hypothetical protein
MNAANWHLSWGLPTLGLLIIGGILLDAIRRVISLLIALAVGLVLITSALTSSPVPVATPQLHSTPAAPAKPPSPPPPPIPAALPSTAEVGICTDGSPSVPRPLATEFLNRLADAVDAWPAGPGGDYRNGAPPQPGLHLVLRSAADRSGRRIPQGAVDGYIDAVPGVPPRLDLDDPRFLDEEPAWASAVRTAESARARALRQAADTADAIRHAGVASGLPRAGDCLMTVAGELLPGHRIIGSLTDLRQDIIAPVRGDLGEATVVVGHACADPANCPRTETGWSHRFAGNGGAAVRFLPPEVFLDVLPDFLRGLYPSSP